MNILAIFICWVVSFFFNGIESGLLSVDPVRLRQNVKDGNRAARRLDRLLKNPERLLVTVLLVTNAADILGLLFLAREFVFIEGSIGFLIAFLVALPVYLILLSVLPKSLFRRFPFRALAALAGVIEFTTWILWPVLVIGALVKRAFGLQRATERGRLFAAREELKQITAQSERDGSLTATERAMIHNVVDFRGVKVGDVMVPLEKIVSVQQTTTIDRAIELGGTSRLDRLPVIGPDGEPMGLINVFDLLLEKNGAQPLSHFMRRLVTATEDEPAYRIVQRLRAARLGLAAVLDRQKNLTGIVSIEDLIGRLVSATQSRT